MNETITPVQGTAVSPDPSLITSIGALISTGVAIAFPEERILLLALRAFIREAPTLYVDFVKMISGTAKTPEEVADFNAKLVSLMDPDAIYKEAAARAGLPYTPPVTA